MQINDSSHADRASSDQDHQRRSHPDFSLLSVERKNRTLFFFFLMFYGLMALSL
jgi:hypothetical protein